MLNGIDTYLNGILDGLCAMCMCCYLAPELMRFFHEKEKRIGRLQRENFRRAWQAGAKMAFGTDAGVYPHGTNAKQFAKMVEWGMKPIEAIQSATIQAAELIGWFDTVGTIEPGHFADIIAVSGDPTADVRVLESVKVVMKGGTIVRNDLAGK